MKYLSQMIKFGAAKPHKYNSSLFLLSCDFIWHLHMNDNICDDIIHDVIMQCAKGISPDPYLYHLVMQTKRCKSNLKHLMQIPAPSTGLEANRGTVIVVLTYIHTHTVFNYSIVHFSKRLIRPNRYEKIYTIMNIWRNPYPFEFHEF